MVCLLCLNFELSHHFPITLQYLDMKENCLRTQFLPNFQVIVSHNNNQHQGAQVSIVGPGHRHVLQQHINHVQPNTDTHVIGTFVDSADDNPPPPPPRYSYRPYQQGCQMAKFDPFLSLDCARVEGAGGMGGNPRN